MGITKKAIILVLRKIFLPIFIPILSEPTIRRGKQNVYYLNKSTIYNSKINENVKYEIPYYFHEVEINKFTYIAKNASIKGAEIGKFCSIGPNFFCGWGIHPTNGISTSPVFYSTRKQTGTSLSLKDKIEERKKIVIGNDVFIGANVTVLDGISIGDGAVIGAGAVVSKDIPPYAIAVGSPIKVIKYRFDTEIISSLLKIKWWNFNEEQLKDVERYFFNIKGFIERYNHKINEI